jgi:anti-sigma factor RsiW
MISDDLRQKLNDYVDGELSEAEAKDVEALLSVDAEARDEVAFLQRLTHEASRLPRAIAPRKDVWPHIAFDIAETIPVKRPYKRWALFAAAAVLLVAVSSGLTAFWLQHNMDRTVVPHESVAPVPAVMAALQTSEQSYSLAIAQLSRILSERRGELSPETVAAIESNLKVIDEAIRASRKALEDDPSNQQSVYTILAMYRKKVDLLQQAVDLPNGG